ncbi:MAG TPA: xanthine dehydrogenase family protein subunit M [Chloroflexota bacterium]|nr:xanthine dehydrogenase family protein subunit M [Chloroflexota bacterium]
MKDFTYLAPSSIAEAVALLAEHQGKTKITAGSTDLLLMMQDGVFAPDYVIDVTHIPELTALQFDPARGLTLGASTPLRRIETNRLVLEKYPHLAKAASEIGSVQIRNRATPGGNICTATPSGDILPTLISLQTTVRLASVRGERSMLLENFITGVRRTVIASDELLVDLQIPAPPPFTSGVYIKLDTRPQMDLAMVGVAATVSLVPGDSTIKNVTLCLGAVAPTPIRVPEAEALLAGHKLTDDLLAQAGQAAARAARPISDVRASADYRREQCDLMTRRALVQAVERARNAQ